MPVFYIWYMKPEFFRDGIMGVRVADPKNLTATHTLLKIEQASNLDGVYYTMQGEIWSPNGEARDLIRSKGLEHTSMSVGDVIVDEAGIAHSVDSVGFKELGAIS